MVVVPDTCKEWIYSNLNMKWIKTKDQLPPVNQLVLVWLGHFPDLMFFNGAMFQSGCLVQHRDKVSHWAIVEKPEN